MLFELGDLISFTIIEHYIYSPPPLLLQLGFTWSSKPETLIKALARQAANVDAETLQKVKNGASNDEDGERAKKKRGRQQDKETWNHRLEQLKAFHAGSGHFRVPLSLERGTKRPRASVEHENLDSETVKLGKWVKRQRTLQKKGELDPKRFKMLTEIGFDFNPGHSTRNERLEIQLGMLDSLRKRREFTNAQVADLTYLYNEWKRRGEENESSVQNPNSISVFASESGKHADKWAANFEKLKAFKVNRPWLQLTSYRMVLVLYLHSQCIFLVINRPRMVTLERIRTTRIPRLRLSASGPTTSVSAT